MPHRVALITDSTCDIPAEWRAQYEITVIPLTIVFGSQQYLDGVEMQPEEFYNRLLSDPTHPSSSQPTPQMFLQAFEQAEANGAEEIMVVTISSAMSGTIHSVEQAAQGFHLPVHIVDGRSNSMGIGWQVIAAARAREAGGRIDEMLAAAAQVRSSMVYYITLDTIDYVRRGGRISEAARLLNSVLKIRPLIYVNRETGAVGAGIPARSRASAIEGLIKEFGKHIVPGKPLHLTVLHNAALDEAKALAERAVAEFKPVEMFISIVSPVLGVHTGPRALALCGYTEA